MINRTQNASKFVVFSGVFKRLKLFLGHASHIFCPGVKTRPIVGLLVIYLLINSEVSSGDLVELLPPNIEQRVELTLLSGF